MYRNLNKLFFLIFICLSPSCIAQTYPLIPELDHRNPVFLQYQEEVSASNIVIASGHSPELNLYKYRATKKDTLLTISARCSVTYDSIATLNSISSNITDIDKKIIILPTVPGLFIPQEPESSIEILLANEFTTILANENIPTYIINERKYYFLENKRFTPAQRAFFLDSSMRLPVEHQVLTSAFGMRVSPISGTWKFHSGIDLACAVGTNVYSCKAGTVYFTGFNTTYGNYIIIKHDKGLTSLYAHLSKILVTKGESVSSKNVIGKTGITGASTGPHLHFEIRLNGNAQNPEKYLTN